MATRTNRTTIRTYGQTYGQTYQAPPIPYSEAERQYVTLYLKDGTIYDVSDYWLVDNQLHFATAPEGGQRATEGVINFGELDLQRTIDVNTQQAASTSCCATSQSSNTCTGSIRTRAPSATPGADSAAPDAAPAGPQTAPLALSTPQHRNEAGCACG